MIPPGWVTTTSGLAALPGDTAAITPAYVVIEYRPAGDRAPWHGTQSLVKTGCRSGMYATVAAAPATAGADVVAGEVAVVAAGLAGVSGGFEGPSGTPFEHAEVAATTTRRTDVRKTEDMTLYG